MRSKIGSHSHRSIHLLWDFLKCLFVLGEGPKVVPNNRPKSRVNVQNGLLECQRIAVNCTLPPSGSKPTKQQEPVLFLGWHLDTFLGQAHGLELVVLWWGTLPGRWGHVFGVLTVGVITCRLCHCWLDEGKGWPSVVKSTAEHDGCI